MMSKGAKFIANIRRGDRKTNEEVNRRANLVPLNQSLYVIAVKIWNRVRMEMREEWAELFIIRPSRKKSIPLNIPSVLIEFLQPIYG